MERQFLNVVGHRLRTLRIEAKLTQSQLVAKCQVAGLDISRVALAHIESGRRTVADYEVQFLALALRVPIQELFPHDPKVPRRKPRNATGPASAGE